MMTILTLFIPAQTLLTKSSHCPLLEMLTHQLEDLFAFAEGLLVLC